MTTYTPTRPIMGRDELASHHVNGHGRDYTVACDGWEDIEAAHKTGWRPLSSWGADGWDLGNWPYVSIQIQDFLRFEVDENNPSPASGVPRVQFLLQSICEGDHDVYAFDSEADRAAALDYLFLWYAAGQTWAPLTLDQREALDAGEFVVDEKYRGPYRPKK